ncbi:hypothetical protein AB0P07_35985 [Streptomyces sp. NPDC085944]|uniref:hypothetical protein n=1 Tax=Streptomyces sp. NPDC085944 TaxID=3154962 RepID=UPI0034238C25
MAPAQWTRGHPAGDGQGIPRVAGPVGRPRRRPDALLAGRGCGHDKYRRLVRAPGITPVIAERGEDHGSGLDVIRWVVKRTIASLFGTTSR